MGLSSLFAESHSLGYADLLVFVAPLWIAVAVGVLVGWVWRPKWAYLTGDDDDDKLSSSPKFSTFLNNLLELPTTILRSNSHSLPSPCPETEKVKSGFVTDDDFRHLWKLVEVKDGGPAWIQMMDRSTRTFSYQAWRRDPENGPPQYRSRTVFEDTTPEMVRDFFWDDEFRSKWDDMLLYSSTLEACKDTGTMVVQWVRKFPFFCSDREYIIGRRIWDAGRVYYCVTKGVQYPSVPRQSKPRRVDLYYSSWCIRAVESRRGDGEMTSCEVMLFHHEDMGIPWEIAKLGVRQGMWGAVKKIEPGLRAYHKARAAGAGLSPSAEMAQINTKVSAERFMNERDPTEEEVTGGEKPTGKNIPKILVVGGAIALACTLDKGLLTKAVIFGVARRLQSQNSLKLKRGRSDQVKQLPCRRQLKLAWLSTLSLAVCKAIHLLEMLSL
ncbi:unnamed protein product [Microthlaspi erraticum]|uniref:START domain-containing protein n=1 Tax=Microthlaspi erraticum TaxID=1685480 RepID=A0A6D2HNG5_9BRAS|nr:unnamed protein product [Microthlaspi erraticum]